MNMISVIMTVFNVEQYIEKAIKSILEQEHTDLELIIVDDCSEDKSIEIAKSFNDSRIKFVKNDMNMGAGYSRKVGIEHATGDYIITIDADDWIEPQFLQNLYNESKDSDMTFGGMIIDFDNAPSQVFCSVIGTFKDRDKFTPMQKKQIIFLNNCLVKKHLYDIVSYDTKRYNEDTPTLAKLIYYANQITITKECGYHYNQRSNSLCHNTKNFYKHLCILKTTLDLINFFEDKPDEYKNLVSFNDILSHLSQLGDLSQIEKHQSEINNLLLKIIKIINKF